MPRITDFCSCVGLYVFGCKLSLVKLYDSDFGITHVDDITIGITCAAFCFHIEHISFASSCYLLLLLLLLLVVVAAAASAAFTQSIFNYIPDTNHVSRVVVLQQFCIYI